MSCADCQAFTFIPITTPEELKRTSAVIQRAINRGMLQSSGKMYPYPFNTTLRQLAKGDWNDTVDHYFICSHCSQPFYLSAETYHGKGGSLKAVEALPEKLEPDEW